MTLETVRLSGRKYAALVSILFQGALEILVNSDNITSNVNNVTSNVKVNKSE